MSIDKAKAILQRLFTRNMAAELARTCETCGLAETLHRKTMAGQFFWLGCEHAKWLHEAIEDSHKARSSEP